MYDGTITTTAELSEHNLSPQETLTLSADFLHWPAMQAAGPIPAEEARLEALRALEILDTAPEPELDDLVQLAAAICDSPLSAISLVDRDRQWFKASLGFDVEETPRQLSLCHYTIQQSGLLVIEDAAADPRFSEHPMVTGASKLRFYAGAPLQTPEGEAIGALCVCDQAPRHLNSTQRRALGILASQVNARIELRSQRRALEESVRQAQSMRERAEALEQRFQTFMDRGPFLAYIKDADGHMLYYNDTLAREFEVSRQALLNRTDHELWPAELASVYRTHDCEVLRSGSTKICHETSIAPDGTTRTWRSYKFPCNDSDGKVLLGGISVDLTEDLRQQAELKRYQAELEQANRRLQELACLDQLTQVLNRRGFDGDLHDSFRHARAANAPLCLLLLDVDRFKSHNDRFGHAHGDSVLRTLAALLKSELRPGDILARYGGEEFAVLLQDTDPTQGAIIGQHLVDSVRSFAWPVAPVTLSAGMSVLLPETASPDAIVACADQALYAAKCAGRDRFISYTGGVPAASAA